MDEVLVIFDEPVYRDAAPYHARACGRVDDIQRWEGWLEFSADGTVWRRTGIETVQPNRRDLEYWVSGLSRVYLQGALVRALASRKAPDDTAPREVPRRSAGGRTSFADVARSTADRRVAPPPISAILDPFAVYVQGESVLRAELGALSSDHLRNIAAAFRIESAETAGMLPCGDLIDRIVSAARGRTTRPTRGEARP